MNFVVMKNLETIDLDIKFLKKKNYQLTMQEKMFFIICLITVIKWVEVTSQNFAVFALIFVSSTCLKAKLRNIFNLLKQILPYFHLSESSFTFPGLRISGFHKD
jgi:hypothetical protein